MVEEKVQNGWILELEHLQQYEHRSLYIRVELLTIKENPDWNLVVVSNSSKQQERERNNSNKYHTCCSRLNILSQHEDVQEWAFPAMGLWNSCLWIPFREKKTTSVIELNKDGLHFVGWSPNLSLNQRIREKVPCHHSQFCFLTERSYCFGQQWIPSPHHDMITCQSSTQHKNNEL